MYILFDIGGTKTRIALSRDGRTFGDPAVIQTRKTFEEGIDAIARTVRDMTMGAPIYVAAGGIAGPLNKDKSEPVGGPNIRGYWHKPVRKMLQDRLRCRVYLENDAVMGGLGEAHYGAGMKKRIVAFVTVSTGVGGSRIENGRTTESAMGFEPGFQIIDAGNSLCLKCSERGYLSDYVSGAAIEKKHKKKPYEITNDDFWDDKSRLLAYGLTNISVLWSPDIIVLGGSMMNPPGIRIDVVREELKRSLINFPGIPDVVKNELGDSAGIYGSLAYLRVHGMM